jgi:hypothetical protein
MVGDQPDWTKMQKDFFKRIFAETEIETAFPELSEEQQQEMVQRIMDDDTFETLGEQLIKAGRCTWERTS